VINNRCIAAPTGSQGQNTLGRHHICFYDYAIETGINTFRDHVDFFMAVPYAK
jgi:hypothetical protein